MSRFYDALKANPSRTPLRNGAEGESDALQQADAADILARLETVGPSDKGTAPAGSSPESASHERKDPPGSANTSAQGVVLPQMEKAPPLQPSSPSGSFGTPTRMRLGNRVRLIGNLLDSMNVEQYRFLRTRILQRQADQMFRTLLVTSSNPGEGKTLTTLNLALVFAMLPSFKVLVVEGDLRKGNLKDWLGVQDQPGLGNLIEGSATLDEVICKPSDLPVSLILRGNSKSSSAELLHSPQMGLHLREMAKLFDLVLVDSPPVNIVADAQLLAASCQATLLVVRTFFTSRAALEEAISKLQRFRVIGTVLNGRPKVVPGYG